MNLKTTLILSLILGGLFFYFNITFNFIIFDIPKQYDVFIIFDIPKQYNVFIISFVIMFIIFIILKIRAFFKRKEKAQRKINQKTVGDRYEKYVGNYYKKLGYKVEFRGLKLGYLDGGIDIIAKNESETLFIQCKYWYKKASINHKMIKEFYGSCHLYIDKQNFNDKQKKDIKCIYAIPSYKTLDYSAIATCKENYKILRYQIIKTIIRV